MKLTEAQVLMRDVAIKVMGWRIESYKLPFLDEDGNSVLQMFWLDVNGKFVMDYKHWCPLLDHDFNRVWARMSELGWKQVDTGVVDGVAHALFSGGREAIAEIINGDVSRAMRMALLRAALEAVGDEDEEVA